MKIRTLRRIRAPYRIQWTPFTCGPACLQMMLAHDGIRLSHFAAIRELKAFPHGAHLDIFQRAYRRITGRMLARITFRGVRRALNRGVPVLAVDSVASPQDHVVILYGYEGDTFHVHDPALISFKTGLARSRRSREELVAAANDEFYAPRGS